MRFGFSEECLAHDPGPRHPESPDRLRAVRQSLARKHAVEYVEADPASRETIEAVHDPAYLDELREFCESGGGDWDPDTVAVEATWDAARRSAGLAAWAAGEALDGADGRRTPFSLGRPPGHHATPDDAMGFCFLNNAAIAAERARTRAGVDRVAVVDWDVHHGNGTQDAFYDRGDVHYASVHETDLYPGTGAVDETGEGAGEGATLNVPLPPGAGDPAYRATFEGAVVPAVERFDPDLVLVSAGFDAHRHDPISRTRLTTEGFGMLTALVRGAAGTADAPVAFVLEGGYGMDTLSDGVSMVHETFDGYEPAPEGGDVDEEVRAVVDSVRETHGLD